jgi:hypothetical protein
MTVAIDPMMALEISAVLLSLKCSLRVSKAIGTVRIPTMMNVTESARITPGKRASPFRWPKRGAAIKLAAARNTPTITKNQNVEFKVRRVRFGL